MWDRVLSKGYIEDMAKCRVDLKVTSLIKISFLTAIIMLLVIFFP